MRKTSLFLLILATIIFSNQTFANASSNNLFEESLTETVIDIDSIPLNVTPPCREPVGLLIDQYLSPYTGAEAMITGLRIYQWADDTFIPSTMGDTSFYMIMGRFGKFLLEETLVSTLMVAQHEFFGHGFRGREFHLKELRYRIAPWSGSTSFSINSYTHLSIQEKIALSSGGIEANDILAQQIRTRWLNACFIDSREAQLYFWASFDQISYVLSTSNYDKTTFPPDGHDVKAYIDEVNTWYQSPVLTARKLRQRVLLSFIDPFLFYSLYSVGQYIIDGNQQLEYFMIPIGAYRYLPTVRLGLAPYGPEYNIINLICGPNHNVRATVRFSNLEGQNSQGISLEITRLFCSHPLTIDGRFDVWRQPRMFSTSASAATPHLGAALTFMARYQLFQQLELVGHAGYKTTGYIPGEILKHSPILRIGFRVNI